MNLKRYNIGIVGATGAVGQELIHLLHEREFPFGEIRLFASARSKGKTISYGTKSWTVEESDAANFEGVDIFLFSAGGSISKALGPEAVKAGGVVIDNSSAFRMDPEVPLVIPEINPDAVKNLPKGIIANPNCSTAVALMGLWPLHKEFGLKRVFASTYQAVSGTGAAAIIELENQLRSWNAGEELTKEVYPHQIAFNVLPHVDSFLDNGYTKEEMKLLNESRKIMSLPDLKATCTCVRVPVMRAHSIAMNAEFERPVDVEKAKKAVAAFEGAELCDEPASNVYPMPLDYAGKEKCGVGRIRKDTALDNGLSLWVSGDQLWKGAALNAVQIAELLVD
jgi:aspartate-semialdehyde dehydrogenase